MDRGKNEINSPSWGVQLEKTGTSPRASCNNKVTSPR